ncbi:MAG: hypothetical protein NTZ53_04445 [Cyanobacteria bacterium]|nr:hypothetical protein [Cyanobacteriota bacterium]
MRWDRINSGDLLARARRIYFTYLEQCPSGGEPLGIVLASQGELGRAVFEPPILLPEEQFVPLDLIRGRSARLRSPRSPFRSPLREGA